MAVLCNPGFSVCTEERALIHEAVLDNGLISEIVTNEALDLRNLRRCMEHLHVVEQLIRSPLTQCQIFMLQKLTATIFQTSVFMLHDMYTDTPRATNRCILLTKGLVTC